KRGVGVGSKWFPVLRVYQTAPPQIYREWRIPVGERFGFRNTGIDGRQIAIGRRALDRNNRRYAKGSRACEQSARILPDVVVQRKWIPRLHPEIARRPFVHDDWRSRRRI